MAHKKKKSDPYRESKDVVERKKNKAKKRLARDGRKGGQISNFEE